MARDDVSISSDGRLARGMAELAKKYEGQFTVLSRVVTFNEYQDGKYLLKEERVVEITERDVVEHLADGDGDGYGDPGDFVAGAWR